LKIADFNPPDLYLAAVGDNLIKIIQDLWQQKTRVPRLSCGIVCWWHVYPFW